jgi:hypothetical protein
VLLLVVYTLSHATELCKNSVDEILIEDLKVTIEEQDDTIARQDKDNRQLEDTVAHKDMIIAKKTEFDQRLQHILNTWLNDLSQGMGGTQSEAVQAHRDFVEAIMKQHEMKRKGESDEIKTRIDEIKQELNELRLRRGFRPDDQLRGVTIDKTVRSLDNDCGGNTPSRVMSI